MAESNLHEGSEAELGAKRFDELLDQNPPDQLYHYTGQEGLLNILESGELWATKVQYMNDTTEIRLAVELADSRLKERIKIIPDEGGRKLVKYIIDGLSGIAHVNICSVSFCKEPDLLSQWRGYSSAGGVAIGFRSVDLKSVAWRDGSRLGHCIYVREDQIKIIEGMIDDLLQNTGALKTPDSADYNQLKGRFERALITFGAFFKDNSFFEEREWRLVTYITMYSDHRFCFKPGISMIIPYYKLQINNVSWKNEIAAVTIGPCPYPEISKLAIDGLLLKHGIADGESPISTLSRIPYRNWY